jgi:hypothetical protein
MPAPLWWQWQPPAHLWPPPPFTQHHYPITTPVLQHHQHPTPSPPNNDDEHLTTTSHSLMPNHHLWWQWWPHLPPSHPLTTPHSPCWLGPPHQQPQPSSHPTLCPAPSPSTISNNDHPHGHPHPMTTSSLPLVYNHTQPTFFMPSTLHTDDSTAKTTKIISEYWA